jgi:uncharacterized protein (DUF2249 family)
MTARAGGESRMGKPCPWARSEDGNRYWLARPFGVEMTCDHKEIRSVQRLKGKLIGRYSWIRLCRKKTGPQVWRQWLDRSARGGRKGSGRAGTDACDQNNGDAARAIGAVRKAISPGIGDLEPGEVIALARYPRAYRFGTRIEARFPLPHPGGAMRPSSSA